MSQRSNAMRLVISGRVQGVGYRYWLKSEAERMGIDGWVRNMPGGEVEAMIVGEAVALDALARLCERGPAAARVAKVERVAATGATGSGFQVIS